LIRERGKARKKKKRGMGGKDREWDSPFLLIRTQKKEERVWISWTASPLKLDRLNKKKHATGRVEPRRVVRGGGYWGKSCHNYQGRTPTFEIALKKKKKVMFVWLFCKRTTL